MAHISDPICYELRHLKKLDMGHVSEIYASEAMQEQLKRLKTRSGGAEKPSVSRGSANLTNLTNFARIMKELISRDRCFMT